MKKKILYQKGIVFIVIAAIILYGCKKPQEKPVADSQNNDKGLLSVIESYYAFTKTKVDGTFMFESNLTNNDANDKNTALAVGVFYDKSGNTQNGGGIVSIGSKQLSPDNAGTYGLDKAYSTDEFFGKKITFILTPPKDISGASRTGGSATVSGSLYSPAAISITNIPARTPVVIQPGMATPITWNTDPNNPNGVIIIAEYLPTLYANRPSLSNGYSSFLTNSMLVTDNGSTAIPWSFFSQYPVGAHIILWVARGNYAILTDGSYNYQIGGYTAAAVWDVSIPAAPPVTIASTNTAADYGFTATYVNASTGTQTVFSIPYNGGNIGTLPVGTYTVYISKSGNSNQRYAYGVCDRSALAVSANFSNVTVNSTCNTISVGMGN